MCKICRRTLCPRGCPGWGVPEGEGEATCAECGAVIPIGTPLYRFGAVAVCEECAERLDVEGLLGRLGLRDRRELLGRLGVERGASGVD